MDFRRISALFLLSTIIAACGGGGGGGSSVNNSTGSTPSTPASSGSSASDAILLPTVNLSGQNVTVQFNTGSAPAAQKSKVLQAARYSISQKATASNAAQGLLVIDGTTWKPVCAINAGVQSSGDSVAVDQACLSDFTVLQATGVNIGNGNVTGTMHIAAPGADFLNGDLAITPLTEIAYADVHLALAAGEPLSDISAELDALAKRLLRSDLNGDGVIDYRDLLAWRPSMTSALRIDLTPLYNAYASGGDVGIIAAQMAKAATVGVIPAGDSSDPVSADNQVTSLYTANNIVYATTSDQNNTASNPNGPTTTGWLHAFTPDGDRLWNVDVGAQVKIEAVNADYLVAVKSNLTDSNINPNGIPDNELLIVPISSSGAPSVIRLPLSSVSIDDVALNGNEAVLATSPISGTSPPSGGLEVIDLSKVVDSATAVTLNSAQLPEVASFNATGDRVAYDNGRIYLANQQGLTVFSLTDSGISQLGQLDFPQNIDITVRNVAVSGTHLYVAGGLAGVLNIDVSDPANPTLIDSFYEGSSLVSASDIYAVFPTTTGVISLGDSSGLRILTLDASGNLQPDGRLFVPNIDGSANGGLLGNELFYVSGNNELRRSAVSAFTGNPWPVGSVTIPGAKATTLTVSGTTAYVGSSPDDGNAQVVAVDISNPGAMSIQRQYPVGGFIFDLLLHDNIAAIANSTWGYETLDLQSGAINRAGLSLTSGTSVGLASFGPDDLVFDRSGYDVFDVTDPANPVFKAAYDRTIDPNCSYKNPGAANCDVPDSQSGLVAGSTLYEASGGYGLSVVQLNQDGSPGASTRISTSDGSGWQGLLTAFSVTKQDNTLYISGCNTGLFLLDVSSPSAPRVESNVPGVSCPWQTVVDNHIAYVMEMDAGISVFDVTDPTNPVYVGSIQTEGPAIQGWAGSTNIFAVDQRSLNAFPLVRALPASRVQ